MSTRLAIKPNKSISFIIKAPNGTTVHQRTSGTVFNASTIFVTLCRVGGQTSPPLNLIVTMSDSNRDGWNGNVLGIMKNGQLAGSFDAYFTTGV